MMEKTGLLKKCLSLLLAVSLILSIGMTTAFAADAADTDGGFILSEDDSAPVQEPIIDQEDRDLQASGADADVAEAADDYPFPEPVITGFDSVDVGVKIMWDAVGADRYRVFYKGKNGWTAMGTTPHPYFYDKDVASGKTYTYSVQCVSAGGKYDTSSMNTVGWKYTYNMDTPQITGFQSLDSGVKITWGKVKNAKNYRVFYYGKNGWTSMGETTATSFIDTDVGSGKTYTYSVRCLKSDGSRYTSDMNTTGWKYTFNMDMPRITSLTSTDKGVQIEWSKVNGASRYAIMYYGKSGWRKMAESSATSYLDTDVRFGSSYTYSVRCINAGGHYTSDYDHKGQTIKHYLATPKITKITDSSKGVTLTWDKVTYAAKYRTYYLNRNGNWVKMGDTASTSFIDDDVSYGSTYTYTVRCITSDGSTFTSDFDHTGWKHTYYQDTPQITGFKSVGRGVEITWKSVGAQKYRVYYYGSKGWTRMGEAAGTSFIDEDVRVGKTYRYTVRAVNNAGKFTSDCDETGWKYTYDPKLSAPVIKECETVSNGVKIMWNAVPDAYKYRVYYKNKNGNWVKMGDTTGLSYVDDVVKGGTTYTYSVRCLAAKSDEFASGYSATKSHTYVDTPSITTLASEKTGVRITWSKPTGATRCRVYYLNRNGNWVKMVETTANTYLDTDVKSGGNYTYTVRCVDANGWFTSWYNTKGWKCTYNYIDWSALYKDFILNKNYLSLPSKYPNANINSYNVPRQGGYDPDFRLYDIDRDGIPELIGYTGYAQYSRHYPKYVYTVKDGKVVYLGLYETPAWDLNYNPDSSYCGLFGDGGSQGIYWITYCYIKNGKLEVKDIASYSPKDYKDFSKGFNYTIKDNTLYQVYLQCTNPPSGDCYFRTPKNRVSGYTYEKIKSMGWNSFIAKYGY